MLPDYEFERNLKRFMLAGLRWGPESLILLSAALSLSALLAILMSDYVEGALLGFASLVVVVLAWYRRNSWPDDDDHDDLIYHGVPVESSEPLEENEATKPYTE